MTETPGVSLKVRVDDDGVGAVFDRLLRLTANLQPVMDEIGGALEASAVQRFEDEEGPDGTPWPDLAESTRTRRGKNARMLRDRGHLVQSITHTASRFETAVGTNKVQARIHQLGGQAGRGLSVEIPARPYLGVSGDDRAAISGILTGHLAELVA